jgi:hypothetical protein
MTGSATIDTTAEFWKPVECGKVPPVSPLVAAPAFLLCLVAYARYAWIARRQRRSPGVGIVDLPLGLAVSLRLDVPPVAARERVRSAFLKTGAFTVIPGEGGRLAFRQGTRASPWFGDLRRPAQPQVFVGSFVAERAEPSGSLLLIRFSTVPIAGWTLVALAAVTAYLVAQFASDHRGPWFWLSAFALLLAVRAAYRAEVRRIAWQLLALLEIREPATRD